MLNPHTHTKKHVSPQDLSQYATLCSVAHSPFAATMGPALVIAGPLLFVAGGVAEVTPVAIAGWAATGVGMAALAASDSTQKTTVRATTSTTEGTASLTSLTRGPPRYVATDTGNSGCAHDFVTSAKGATVRDTAGDLYYSESCCRKCGVCTLDRRV